MLATALLLVGVAGGFPDTIRVELGSPLVDGRVYRPHRARVRVWREGADAPIREWINELAIGDSAGRAVMRWSTLGQFDADGKPGFVLLQTYDHRTLAPLGYSLTTRGGTEVRLAIRGTRVTGTRKLGASATPEPVDHEVERLGFVASASDLVPLAVGLAEAKVVIAPVWGPNMPTAENRIFTVLRQEPFDVEGESVVAWRVEERRESDGKLMATWFLTDRSPYMVGGETYPASGGVERYTEVALP
ncbi:MAG: hypothetical protein R2909_21275 [Gemmatimonadales bacterium]